MKDKTVSQQVPDAKGQKVRPKGGTSAPRLRRAFLESVGAVLAPMKDPMRQEQGRKGARARWGKPKEQTPEQLRGQAVARQNNLKAINAVRETALSRLSRSVGESAANLLMTNAILSQGAAYAAEYLIDLVKGKYADAPHGVRVDAAKAVIDRASALHGLKLAGNGGSVPLNQWTFSQLQQFVEANDGTVTIEPASDYLSDRDPLLSTACEGEQPAPLGTVAQGEQPAQSPVDGTTAVTPSSPAGDPPAPP